MNVSKFRDHLQLEGLVSDELRRISGDRCPNYDELASVARRWIEIAKAEIAETRPEVEATAILRLSSVVALCQKSGFAEFRRGIAPQSTLQRSLLELFLETRIRLYVLAYLSVQEGEAFEGETHYETRIPEFLSQLMGRLGRRSCFQLRLNLGLFGMNLDLDPLVSLRAAYATLLFRNFRKKRSGAWSHLQFGYHKSLFRLKSWILSRTIRHVGRRGGNTADGVARLLKDPFIQRMIAFSVLLLFEEARSLSDAQWTRLLNELNQYLIPRLSELARVIPDRSFQEQGIIKLCKVAFGVIAGRTSVRNLHEQDPVDFIVNTFRLAYSWGLTYPLVDNVLDSASTTSATRAELLGTLQRVFSAGATHETSRPIQDPAVREVFDRLQEALSLIPSGQISGVRQTLMNLLESHHRDSKRRLGHLKHGDRVEDDVLIDTALKAAMIRLATMEVCGIRTDHATTSRCIVRSLFNQLGDDLWDIYEDHVDDRVTPFTLFLTKGTQTNPFRFYLDYSVLLTRGMSERRQHAAFIGFSETLRDAILTLSDGEPDPLGVQQSIQAMLDQALGPNARDDILQVPHVDFDAVIFSFERAILECLA